MTFKKSCILFYSLEKATMVEAMEGGTHQKKRTLSRITNPKLAKTTYMKRKQCIKKKTMELGILCGIDACTVIFGPNGEVDTWPENPNDVKSIIGKYREYNKNHQSKKRVKQSEFFVEGRNPKEGSLDWEDDWINGLSTEDLHNLLGDLDLKLQAVENRLGLLNSLNDEQNNAKQGNRLQQLQTFDNPIAFGNSCFPANVEAFLNDYRFCDYLEECVME